MGKWRLIGGAWVISDEYTHQNEPTIHGITPGQPPAGFVHEIKKDLRRYDKPSDSEIRRAVEEDEKYYKDKLNTDGIVQDAKKGLESGQIKIDPEVIDEREKKINNHGSVVDERGITHILPKYKLPVEESKVNFTENEESVSITLGRAESGNLPERTNIKKLEQLAIDAARRGENKHKTFG
jgi:hypothetical protein